VPTQRPIVCAADIGGVTAMGNLSENEGNKSKLFKSIEMPCSSAR